MFKSFDLFFDTTAESHQLCNRKRARVTFAGFSTCNFAKEIDKNAKWLKCKLFFQNQMSEPSIIFLDDFKDNEISPYSNLEV